MTRQLHELSGKRHRPLILHIPYTFFPDNCGGTEIYVLGLAKGLVEAGFASAIAAPAEKAIEYDWDGIRVHRFAVGPQTMAHAYGLPDEVAVSEAAQLINSLRPAVVHLHARTAAVSERLAEVARAAGARVVLTYHTPTVSCARGTMLWRGSEPCDGTLERRRCVSCTLEGQGLSRPLAQLLAYVPAYGSEMIAGLNIPSPLSALRIPGLIGRAHHRFSRLTSTVDNIVAVCEWVAQVLRRNGVPEAKLTLCRQGLPDQSSAPNRPVADSVAGPLRIAYFGRLDWTKGVDLLPTALAMRPQLDILIDLFLVTQPGSGDDLLALQRAVEKDPRLAVHLPVPHGDVSLVMSRYDLVAVPSRTMETGPLVVLEAFAAGVPVLGSNHGGISELVEDGITGTLFPPGNPDGLADLLEKLAGQRELIKGWRRNIKPPRTMGAVVTDMALLYRKLLQ